LSIFWTIGHLPFAAHPASLLLEGPAGTMSAHNDHRASQLARPDSGSLPQSALQRQPMRHLVPSGISSVTSRSPRIASHESRVTNRRSGCKNRGFQSLATVKSVLAGTSATDRPPQAPTFRAASHQSATVGLPLANRRCRQQPPFTPHSTSSLCEESASPSPSLIYGTGIKITRISFTLNEYRILIHCKPRSLIRVSVKVPSPTSFASSVSFASCSSSASSACFPLLCANISHGEFACRT
jgi:hypothetical protein